MVSESTILENQMHCLKRTYEEYQLIAQRHRVEYERTKRRLHALSAPACSIAKPTYITAEPECET